MSTNTSNVNYIAEFYKEKEHNYADFFKGYVDNGEIAKCDKEIKDIMAQLEEKREERSRLYANRYNEQFTPLDKQQVVYYSNNRTDVELFFDIVTGCILYRNSIEKDANIITIDTKVGSFEMVAGYCLPLGAIVSRKYSYKIATNNSHCSFNLVNEWIIPVIDYDTVPVNKDGEQDYKGINSLKATEFIQTMYGIPEFNYSITIQSFMKALRENASTEIILKTSPSDEVTKLLLDNSIDKAEPIYKIVGVTKNEYDVLVEKNILVDYIKIRRIIDNTFFAENRNYNNPNIGLTEKDFFHYTVSDWIDIIEKAQYWVTELEFNKVQVPGNLISTLLGAYVRNIISYHDALFYKYYSFSKFMDYVCEESCNQGFQRLGAFLVELKDYLNMCQTMNVTPSLYTAYLKQTHDILARNYNIKVTEEQEEMFASRYEGFETFTTVDKKYSVVAPHDSDDIKQEGYNLNHCVASYINKVIKGTSKILFLRKAQKASESLVTMEIVNNAIVQARGASNRSINEKEYTAIKEFALKNKMNVMVNPRR